MSAILDSARFLLQQRDHQLRVLPIVIVYLNTICDSRCVTCSSWKNNELLKIPAERQMPDPLREELYGLARKWQPRQVLLSGGEPALHPRFAQAIRSFKGILDGAYDHLPEAAFSSGGSIDEAVEKAMRLQYACGPGFGIRVS